MGELRITKTPKGSPAAMARQPMAPMAMARRETRRGGC